MSNELQEKLKKYRMNQEEYDLAQRLLGRPPKGVEWALFSALWSEHCSYKSSKVHLKKLFRKSPRVLEAEGENAGVVDLGQGERVAFKMESHNHPSFIEPYQGAATGVGGILRDIFTMGSRPILLGNYLCFGEPKAPRMKSLVDGVVRGIGGYGNCVGVPNITGQTEFHASYNGNILVNAFALGYFAPGEKVHLSKANGPGNRVIYVGARTGRDGVHGASMASESFDESSESKRPTVQIGDPFFEKLLIEACLEVMNEDLVAAIQDMGAAGLTSSSFEMASKGQVGLTIDLSKVPLRDSSCGPEEILLSESQERMLLIAEPSKVARIQEIFHRWNLESVDIGEVTHERKVRLLWKGETLTEIDPDLLVEKAPQYQRPYNKWTPTNKVDELSKPDSAMNFQEQLLKCLGSEAGCSREWIYRQYDQRVMTQTAQGCDETTGVVRLPHSGRGLTVALGCRPHVMRLDAELGGIDSIAYPILKMSLKGFEPLAVTDCLNFASPEKTKIMSEFVASLEGMSRTCEKFGAPIISGNVSFYNETLDQPITSTPSTGVVGLRPSVEKLPTSLFSEAGEKIYLLSLPMVEASGLVAEMMKLKTEFKGQMQLDEVVQFAQVLRDISNRGLIHHGRVLGQFGLLYGVARMCVNGIGAQLKLPELSRARLFGETFYEVVVTSKAPDFVKSVEQLAKGLKTFKVTEIGTTGGEALAIAELGTIPLRLISEHYFKGWENSVVS